MRAIVNVNKNWGIGKDGDLLVYIPEDMKFFRTTTAGKIVIMGRKTLESFPGKKPLAGRINIVLTADPARIPQESIAAADAYFCDLTEESANVKLTELTRQVLASQELPAKERPTVLAVVRTIEDAAAFCTKFNNTEEYVIGGASIYEKMLPYCDTCIVTINDSENVPDSYFPNLDEKPEWEHSVTGEMKEYEGVHFHFDTFVRV